MREARVEVAALVRKNPGWRQLMELILQPEVDGVMMEKAQQILADAGGTVNLHDVKNAHALHFNHAREMWEFHSPAHRVAAEQWLKEQANKE